ncbi:hypothetical protein B0H21DRAFT_38603 [Amylocystis lapponica]|nr:hypothetical protein B0H21DRAFT_38603 [Amylocystis lapponica]
MCRAIKTRHVPYHFPGERPRMSQSTSSQSTDEVLDFDIYAGLPEGPLDLGLEDSDMYFLPDGSFSLALPGQIIYPNIPTADPQPYGYLPQTPQSGYIPYNPAMLSEQWYPYPATFSPAPTTPIDALPPLPPAYRLTSQTSASSHTPASPPSTAPTAPQRLRVPQTIQPAHSVRSPASLVTFDLRSGSGGGGVRVYDALKERAELVGHDERVLGATGVRQIRLVIAVRVAPLPRRACADQCAPGVCLWAQWPGYEALGAYIPVQDGAGFVTRARLAKLVSLHVARFVSLAAKKQVAREHAQWAVGKRAICLEQLWLRSVAHAQKNIWLAELEVQP